jgi:hypothetical protein
MVQYDEIFEMIDSTIKGYVNNKMPAATAYGRIKALVESNELIRQTEKEIYDKEAAIRDMRCKISGLEDEKNESIKRNEAAIDAFKAVKSVVTASRKSTA